MKEKSEPVNEKNTHSVSQLQHEIRLQERRYRASFEQAAVGMAHVALDGKWLLVNQKFCDIVGYTRQELQSKTMQAITHADDFTRDLVNINKLINNEITTYTTEQRYIRKDNSWVWVFLTLSLLCDEEGKPLNIIAVIEDIDERRHMRERFKIAQMVGRIGTFDFHIPTNTILWTPELEALYGLPKGGFEGKYENWTQRVHPDDLARAKASLQGAIQGGPPYNVEFRIIWPDGTQRWILAKGEVTAYNSEGKPLSLIGVNIDITQRKEIEEELARINMNLETLVAERTEVLQQLNLELQRSNQELQDFAYVASHDLQEPLRKIQAFGNLLEEEHGSDLGDGKVYLDRMRNAAGRMRVLIEDLLTFSRVTTKAQPFTPVDLNLIMQQVSEDLEQRIQTTKGKLEVEQLPTINADPVQIYQMLQNLISNSFKFYRHDVVPTVKVYARLQKSSESAEEQWAIYIEDNGIGFDTKYLDRIFTVFQRLHGKNEYEGTGIGLAVVRKIVERHNGTITAHSTIGKGSTFIITLPAQPKQ